MAVTSKFRPSVDARVCDLPRQVGEHTRPILDLDDDDLALAAHGELRECQRVPGRFGMRNEDVQLDLIRRPHARRRRKVHAGVTDRGRDVCQRARLVRDLDDQVVRDGLTLSDPGSTAAFMLG